MTQFDVAFDVPGEARPASARRCPARVTAGGKLVQGRMYEPRDRTAWRSDVRAVAAAAMGDKPPMVGPLVVSITIMRVKPKSWSRKRWAWDVKPDIDNLTKPIWDACKSVVWLDDAQIVDFRIQKVHGDRCRTVMWVRQATEADMIYARTVAEGVAERAETPQDEWAAALVDKAAAVPA